MKDNKVLKYLIAVGIPVIILLSMTIQPLLTVLFGREITLETRPLDPRDVFMGDYVILNYKIEEIEAGKFPKELIDTKQTHEYSDWDGKKIVQESYNSYVLEGKDLYSVLKRENGFYTVDFITTEKPKNGEFLKCKIVPYYNRYDEESTKTMLRINYSLDKYYVPENTGRDLETASSQGQLIAKAKVRNGYAILMDVYEK